MSSTRIAILTCSIALAIAAPLTSAHAGDNDVDKVNGSIDAEAGHAWGSLETVNGSIRIASGAITGSAETVNGSIKAGDNAHSGGLTTVNGSIHLGSRVQVDGGIETVNGGVFVDRGGQVAKGVTTVNGAIGLVDADLGGGIDTVNGDITVGVGSHVKGGIKVEKPSASWLPITFGKRQPPRIIIGPDAVVDGPLVFEREVKLYVHSSARIGGVTGATAVPYSGDRPPQD
ncbi:hypothetical protein [Cognatiluteimonas profundi]|uniref:hypothetical protein n=1 Tax=Cognatiluteimonas profundi TaxID=2594501 RepID=UPI0018EEE391|nr:hypothetical protein [Lysobacter profundi]